jgi:hypothetical protein
VCFAPKICDDDHGGKRAYQLPYIITKTDIAVLDRMLCSVKTALILLAGY